VAVADRERTDAALRWVAELRAAGLRVDWDASGERSVKAQFKAANRSGAAAVAVVGAEWADGMVSVKDMDSGEERPMAVEEVARWTSRH